MESVARLTDYPHRLSIPTRWKDNDVYGHVNNVEYYSFFDTVINTYLIREGGLDIHHGPVIGLCVASQCDFSAPLAFPDTVVAGLRVTRLGRKRQRGEPIEIDRRTHVTAPLASARREAV